VVKSGFKSQKGQRILVKFVLALHFTTEFINRFYDDDDDYDDYYDDDYDYYYKSTDYSDASLKLQGHFTYQM